MTVHVTHHAVDRYIERIAPVGRDQAVAIIRSAERAIEQAAAFGAHVVRLGNGAKLVLRGVDRIRVITVLRPSDIDRGRYEHLNSHPVCCGQCGLRCGYPQARACTRTDCALPIGSRCANDGGSR